MNKKDKVYSAIHRLVVKVGTANLCDQTGFLDQNIFDDFARQISELMKSGMEVIVVSSGAIKAGREEMGYLGLDIARFHKKDLAGIGARHLMNRWGEAFVRCEKEVGQIWVTFSNWKNKGERKSIKSSIFGYLNSMAVVPIVNEADVISDREVITYLKGLSENDKLARMIAFLTKADAILFLTDKGGIYTEDPLKNIKARPYKEINAWSDPESIGITNGTSKNGTGGMMAKWKEASMCARKGMQVAIAGNEKNIIIRFAVGNYVGTKIGKKTRLK